MRLLAAGKGYSESRSRGTQASCCAAWGLGDLGYVVASLSRPPEVPSVAVPGLAQDAEIQRVVAVVPADAVILCENDLLVYLLTGRQTMSWYSTWPVSAVTLRETARRAGARRVYALAPPAGLPALVGWHRVPTPSRALYVYRQPEQH